jgi:hypothetical protein
MTKTTYTYNYENALYLDVKNYLFENPDVIANRWDEEEKAIDIDGLKDDLNDILFTEDSVTGNASGSYTFSRYDAKEYVTENIDTCLEALESFDVDAKTVGEKFLYNDWEYFDVTIRCYLLGGVIDWVVNDLFDDLTVEEIKEMIAEYI